MTTPSGHLASGAFIYKTVIVLREVGAHTVQFSLSTAFFSHHETASIADAVSRQKQNRLVLMPRQHRVLT